MFEKVFKNIDEVLRDDANCDTELDYAEQSSWALFLKWLDDYEKDKESLCKLEGKEYENILEKKYRWSSWGNFNDDKTGEDLQNFVNQELFPYLASFKNNSYSINSVHYKIGEIFTKLDNKLEDGYSLKNLLNEIDSLNFRTNENKHELSSLYEERIKRVGNAGRNGGEYYTPRPLIRIINQVINPKIGEKIYDGACGSSGFLVEAFNYIKDSKPLTSTELIKLQKETLFGKEKKRFPYIIGTMNMILHGIEVPNIIRKNTLEENILEIQDSERYDVVLANPPFGGDEKEHIKESFPIQTSETALLFLQHFIKILKIGGRAGIVIKSTFLTNDDAANVKLRKLLIEECNLHTILDLPSGTFQGASIKTIVLFFDKGKRTDKIWFYQLNLDRNLGKKKPLSLEDLEEFILFQKDKKSSPNSWSFEIKNINTETYELPVKNPNKKDTTDKRTPSEIINSLQKIDEEIQKSFQQIKKNL